MTPFPSLDVSASKLCQQPSHMKLWRVIHQAMTGRYTATGSIAAADCAIAFAFGINRLDPAVAPGQSNRDLASFVVENCSQLPIIAQQEVAEMLQPTRQSSELIVISRHRASADKYLDTREVAEQAYALMGTRGWSSAVIVAHPFHIARATAVCGRLGIQTISPAGLDNNSILSGI